MEDTSPRVAAVGVTGGRGTGTQEKETAISSNSRKRNYDAFEKDNIGGGKAEDSNGEDRDEEDMDGERIWIATTPRTRRRRRRRRRMRRMRTRKRTVTTAKRRLDPKSALHGQNLRRLLRA